MTDKVNRKPKARILTGERPTGRLHIGHLFGTLQKRLEFQAAGMETFIVMADYQVLTDREICLEIKDNVKNLVLDYLAVGLDPLTMPTYFFPQSAIPELNHLMVPFLSLVSQSELARNPTIKAEIRSANLTTINANMMTYPVHQAADILCVRGTLVPVGEDQLPHLELCQLIAKRFNKRFGFVFPEPEAILSEGKRIMGLDGNAKMSKSLHNAIFLSSTKEEVKSALKNAKTDSDRHITFEPKKRPEVANLLQILSLCSDRSEQDWAQEIGSGGAGKLKGLVTDALIALLDPIQRRRKDYEKDPVLLNKILQEGIQKTRQEAQITLQLVNEAMGTVYQF
jgi:tryptophanyl-tRNA synthetase